METCLISILFDYSGTLIILLYLSDEKSGHEWNIISQFPCIRPFFSTCLHQSQFKYANILNSEHKSCFGNVRILLLPMKLELIHHLGTIEPWHELTKQSRLNRLSTCVIDRALIFETITNEKYFNETSVSQFE